MPAQRKKTKPKAKVQKKTTSKKRTPKRRTRRGKKKSNLKKNIFIALGVLFIIAMVVFGYFLGNNNTKTLYSKTSQQYKTTEYSTEELLTDLSKIETKETKVIKKEKLSVKPVNHNTVVKKEVKVQPEKRVEKKKQTQPMTKVSSSSNGRKPRLAIVIDDVSSITQMKRIQGTGIKLTPAIFPPSELSMNSHKLAIPLEHYMIHLPLESGSTKFNTHYKTLMVNSSVDRIEERVKEIRRLFPKAKYINNHTGSVFTADYKAMFTLYKALANQGFVFIDSRTVGDSKVKKVVTKFGHRYISRDIFIDNEHNIPYIHRKLKEAVAVAKKKGYAIAIGHPHKVTMEALQDAKMILSDVDVVYIEDIFTNKD